MRQGEIKKAWTGLCRLERLRTSGVRDDSEAWEAEQAERSCASAESTGG